MKHELKGDQWIISLSFGFAGALYNIIQVPPERADEKDTLQGAKILCSIVPANKSHPSYYHSFGRSSHLISEIIHHFCACGLNPFVVLDYCSNTSDTSPSRFQPCLRTTWCSLSSRSRWICLRSWHASWGGRLWARESTGIPRWKPSSILWTSVQARWDGTGRSFPL